MFDKYLKTSNLRYSSIGKHPILMNYSIEWRNQNTLERDDTWSDICVVIQNIIWSPFFQTAG